jgi:DNA-binding transcriptional LysR family regulator
VFTSSKRYREASFRRPRRARRPSRNRDLRNDIAGGDSQVAGTVRLTAVPILVNRLLVPASRQLLDRCPQLHVEIVADFRDLSLAKREADIALRLAAPKKETGNAVLARKIGLLRYDV